MSHIRNLRSRSYFLVRSLLESGAAIDDLDLIVAVLIVDVAVCQVFLRSSLPRHIRDRTLATFGWSIGNDQPETAAFLQYVDSCYHSLPSMRDESSVCVQFGQNRMIFADYTDHASLTPAWSRHAS